MISSHEITIMYIQVCIYVSALIESYTCMVAMSYLLCLSTVLLLNCYPSKATGKSLTAYCTSACACFRVIG